MSAVTLQLPQNRSPKQINRTLESELSDALKHVASERNRQLVARRLGWDGQAPCSLVDAGVRFRLTRERARQLLAVALPVLRQNTIGPALDAVLAFVKEQRGELVSDVEQWLVQLGLMDGSITLPGVLCAAQVFRRRPTFQLNRIGDTLFVGPVWQVARIILKTAMKNVAHHGATRVSDLRLGVSRIRRRTVDEQLVRRILGTRSDVRWLDDTSEWFWLAMVPRNRLLARVRKVLAVCPQIHVSKLKEAISRARPPLRLPETTLRSICAQLSWCRVTGQCVESRVVLRIDDVLGEAEAIVCALLRDNGGPLPVTKLESLCWGRGVKEHNLCRILSVSPVIERFGKGIYGLVGASATE
jgi:hypothetical protein